VEPINPEIIEALRQGRGTFERKMAVCSSGAHIPPLARVEILAALTHDPDERIASQAEIALLNDPDDIFLDALKRDAAQPHLFDYVAKNRAMKPAVLEALVRNRNCPGDTLAALVPHLPAPLVHLLVDELDRVSDSAPLVVSLEHSPHLSTEHKNTLKELHSTEIDAGRLAEAAEEAEPDPVRRQTLLQKIGRMTVSQRVQYAMKGGSEARRTLIRDTNKVVQRAVLQSPRLTDQEVEAYASMANLTDEILRLIASNRNFRKNYVVVRNLMNNPKTPLDVTMHMLPILNAVDLKKLTMNKNVPETLRTTATKLQKTRAEQKNK
jgi:hypothetical protein